MFDSAKSNVGNCRHHKCDQCARKIDSIEDVGVCMHCDPPGRKLCLKCVLSEQHTHHSRLIVSWEEFVKAKLKRIKRSKVILLIVCCIKCIILLPLCDMFFR